jgi:RNA polymerase sigma factor (sigma-70 family)
MTFSRRSSPAGRAANESEASEALFEAQFEQHWERLCRVLYSILGDWDEAEDLALETFVRLHRRPPIERERLSGWLYRVASNQALNALRARRRRQRYEEAAGHLALETHPPEDPAIAVELDQERQRARLALGMIKPRSAQMLLLRHSGMSYAEIAAAVGVSAASVGALLRRAEAEFERAYSRAAG